MNTFYKIATICFVTSNLFVGCNSSKKSTYNADMDNRGKLASSNIILKAPINSADKMELNKKIYSDDKYMLLQNPDERFKDNAPFIELLDSGKRERLWFSSSRADDHFYAQKITNNYQQIYFTEREVGEGKTPYEGWGEVTLFEVSTDNTYLKEIIQLFNKSTKGAVTIANNTMIFSSDMIKDGKNSEIKDLWEIKLKEGEFSAPKPIIELSSENTWESQPTLSQNGKHLFFVSNRKIDSDGKIDKNLATNDLNIFYSFNKGNSWTEPVAVSELNSSFNDVTPQISYNQTSLFFSSNRDGNYQIFEVPLNLDDKNGGFKINKSETKLFSHKLFNITSTNQPEILINDEFNQQYPFIYYNPLNKKSPRSLFWASDAPSGYGSYDIFACDMPFEIQLNAILVDLYPVKQIVKIEFPVIELTGYEGKTIENEKASFHLYSGLNYQLLGGSTANSEKGIYICDADKSHIFLGYSRLVGGNPFDKEIHSNLISGAEVKSKMTGQFGRIPMYNIISDTTLNDTIFITKAWKKKPPCPGKLNIEPTYRSIAYFQTGFWEVNTSENLKRDLAKLHEGFVVQPGKNIYNPTGEIIRNLSDYKAIGQEAPIFPVNTNDKQTYSIANAQWIELHPNNQYWGDRPGYEASLVQRMKGRKNRINQYVDYAIKVDENLKDLTDTIKNKYLYLLDLHKELKPKLLIEIFAVSDKREVTRSWYIGDTIQYRGSEYLESQKRFDTEMVKIVQPEVDERTKTLSRIKPCSIELNKDGDNGSILGISGESTDLNTNLSRLRAWFGYKEVLQRLADSEIFNRYLNERKVALPDNSVSYDNADVIIITRGKREDGDVLNPQYPYPYANNPTGNGFFDYDKIRRIEIQCRLLFEKEKKSDDNYCCDPTETSK